MGKRIRDRPWTWRDADGNFYQDNEHGEQAKVFKWLRELPYPWAQAAFAVPNQALFDEDMRLYFAEEGALGGVTDFIIPLAAQGYNFFAGEMKYGDGRLRDSQRRWGELAEQCGACLMIAWTSEDMISLIRQYAGLE